MDEVARQWCLFLVWPARLNPGSFRMTLFLCVSWSRMTVALFLLAICLRTLSLAMVSPSMLSCEIARLSMEESANPEMLDVSDIEVKTEVKTLVSL